MAHSAGQKDAGKVELMDKLDEVTNRYPSRGNRFLFAVGVAQWRM